MAQCRTWLKDFRATVEDGLSIAHGIPLSEEKGIGALTLGGYFREVTQRFGPNEMGCQRKPGLPASAENMERWTYAEAWDNGRWRWPGRWSPAMSARACASAR